MPAQHKESQEIERNDSCALFKPLDKAKPGWGGLWVFLTSLFGYNCFTVVC